MNAIEQADRRAELLIPKLEAFRMRCGGAMYHEISQHYALVKNYRDMMQKPGRLDPEDLARELLEISDKAEAFLKQIVFV